ncbi:hypothetical protein QUB68_29570 [Microcoleus sp. A006_D1]|uniref:hypothetical protein n=1 Tax=Microcoleus sp. A006_D1 TaxID=3055267 RepID=UPI002FD531D9
MALTTSLSKGKVFFTAVAGLLFVALVAGCGGEKPSGEQATQSSTEPPTSSASPALPASSSGFKRKEIPILGTTYGQTSDQTAVLDIIASGKSRDEIPQASSAGVTPNPIAVKLGYPPKETDVCNLPYQALIRETFEKCFSQGMSPTDVANILGWEGKEVASSGSAKTYEWQAGEGGSMVIVFEGDRLVSKSQTGLKP